MPQWLQDIIAEWPMIRSAPRSFAIVTVTSVVALGAAIWFALNWSYGAVLSAKDAQNAVLRERIAAYEQKLQGATPDQAAQEIIRLKAEVEALKNPPRDSSSLYQDGRIVAAVAGTAEDSANKLIAFRVVTASNTLDMSKPFEYRRLVLLCEGEQVSSLSFGAARQINYGNVRCRITGNR
jgi:hypothetical protein